MLNSTPLIGKPIQRVEDCIINPTPFKLTYKGKTTFVGTETVTRLQLAVSKNEIKPSDFVLEDEEGTIAQIRQDGIMANVLDGMQWQTYLSWQLLKNQK